VAEQQTPAEPAGDESDTITVYEAAGGLAFFEQLVEGFYRRVATDPVLLELYPDQVDLGPAKQRLALFLAQYWGGPTTYSEQRGHPRLRMRHFPYSIGDAERDHWLAAMTEALDELDPHPILRERFDNYFTMSAEAMRNREG
jgi:hemoglobin